jgi:cytochrome c oxidase subunit 2
MISWYITQASSYAAGVDGLILLIALIIAPFFLAAEFVLVWLIFRFRARPGVKARYITGEKQSETKWVTYPHYLVLVFDVIIVVAALRVWSDVKMDLPPADERVRIIAQQWAWTFVHAGPDGQLDTADDIRTVNVLNLQVNRLYHYELHSRDVLHSLSVPAFRLKQDAVPGREINAWFDATKPGKYEWPCAELCGFGHSGMKGWVYVHSPADYEKWAAENLKADAAAPAQEEKPKS